jgi:uncharacterized protein RhaS with RHS repeats
MMHRKRAAIATMTIGLMGTIALPVRADFAQDLIARMMGNDRPVGRTYAYGTGQRLTQQQSNILKRQELRFPQTYEAMTKRFGYPNGRSSQADFYDLADGRRVSIVYVDRRAVSVEGI